MKPKEGEYWWIRIGYGNTTPTVAHMVMHRETLYAYPCGDEEGWPHHQIYEFVKRIPMPRKGK